MFLVFHAILRNSDLSRMLPLDCCLTEGDNNVRKVTRMGALVGADIYFETTSPPSTETALAYHGAGGVTACMVRVDAMSCPDPHKPIVSEP